MAELKNRYFGEIKGSFGDVVFRRRNGKNYTARKPRKYTKPNTEEYINRVNAFRTSIKFSSVVNSIPELKKFWSMEVSGGKTPYQYLISRSFDTFKSADTVLASKITPNKGFGVVVDECTLNGTSLNMRIQPLLASSGIDTGNESKIKLISIIQFYEPLTGDSTSFEFITLNSNDTAIDLNESLNFTIQLSTAQANTLALYKKCRIFSTLITYDAGEQPVKYANTFSSTAAIS